MNNPRRSILVVDDEQQILDSTTVSLRAEGFDNVIQCRDSRAVADILGTREVGVVLLDLFMPHVSGSELLEFISTEHPGIPVIIITGADEVDVAVDCMKRGARDYLVKPAEKSRLVSAVKRLLELRTIEDEYSAFKEGVFTRKLKQPEAFSEMVSRHPDMLTIFVYMEAIAATSWPVLITGETGTGKEVAARAIHALSGRVGEFVVVNVAGVDETTFSDTLFGHLKGAYTGADRERNGLAETARHGTLFLDEIGDLAPAAQVKLLRLLQDSSYYPLGSDVPKRTDARIIVATNCSLELAQNEGRFRKDLYYRLMTHHVHLPPLRERASDIPILLDYFLEKTASELNKKKPSYSPELPRLLSNHLFPGNVRELESMTRNALALHPGRVLSMESFRKHLKQASTACNMKPSRQPSEESVSFGERIPTLDQCRELLIAEAMRRAGDNQTIAAEMLGISRSALNKRINRGKSEVV